MDIELLSRMIGELVLDHSSVGLPGLGTFIVEDVPASFSDRGYTINPPYRSLSFSPDCQDDSAIVSYYAECNNIGVNSSRAILTDYLTQLKGLLSSRKNISFPGFGRLRATDDGRMFFIPDENLVIYPDGLPLEPISLKNHVDMEEKVDISVANLSGLLAKKTHLEEKEKPVEENVPVDEEIIDDVIPKSRESKYRIPFRVLLFILVAVVVFFSAYIILAQVAPDFIDSILYTPEELEIINW